MGNSLLDICVFGRRAGLAAAAWSHSAQLGRPTVAHLEAWRLAWQEAGIEDLLPSPMILPDYTRKNLA